MRIISREDILSASLSIRGFLYAPHFWCNEMDEILSNLCQEGLIKQMSVIDKNVMNGSYIYINSLWAKKC